jgi:hypothetical protein
MHISYRGTRSNRVEILMTMGRTTLELASATLEVGTIWTLGTVMSKIAF